MATVDGVSAGMFATKSRATLWHSTYVIAENARSSHLLHLGCRSRSNVPISHHAG
jgi:hypothetical protein